MTVSTRTMPAQRPGQSEQTVRTPPEFLAAVRDLLVIRAFHRDLAACANNAVARRFYTKEQDGLAQSWDTPDGTWNWLNPEYADIAPWVEKAHHEKGSGNNTVVLIPASVGSNWWARWVHDKAFVLFLNGRIKFLDKGGSPIRSAKTGQITPYPKDLALLVYSKAWEVGYEPWRWQS